MRLIHDQPKEKVFAVANYEIGFWQKEEDFSIRDNYNGKVISIPFSEAKEIAEKILEQLEKRKVSAKVWPRCKNQNCKHIAQDHADSGECIIDNCNCTLYCEKMQ